MVRLGTRGHIHCLSRNSGIGLFWDFFLPPSGEHSVRIISFQCSCTATFVAMNSVGFASKISRTILLTASYRALSSFKKFE